MKKNFNLLVMFFALAIGFTSCSDDEDMGAATISLNKKTLTITEGKFAEALTGTVKAPEGAQIESITVTATYKKDDKTESKIIATEKNMTEGTGSSKKSSYSFSIDESNNNLTAEIIASLEKIRVTANVKDGDQSEEECAFEHKAATTDLEAAKAFLGKKKERTIILTYQNLV